MPKWGCWWAGVWGSAPDCAPTDLESGGSSTLGQPGDEHHLELRVGGLCVGRGGSPGACSLGAVLLHGGNCLGWPGVQPGSLSPARLEVTLGGGVWPAFSLLDDSTHSTMLTWLASQPPCHNSKFTSQD